MKKTLISILAISSFAILSSCGSTDTKDTKEVAKDSNEVKFDNTQIEDDTKFAVNAADGGMLEVQLGKLAQTNGASQTIKDLGKMMETDHTTANNELKDAAAKKNITLPAALGEKNQKKYDDLATKKGNDFDKAYADAMVSDHNEDIDAFKKEAEKGNDADLKAWAAGKLPLLEHHLEMSKAAKDAVKK